ncbi:STAS domain-containing protein [candidate division KSB1 bacterium]|nr:STAS domain-containing protein [candidate division KSB1 bacterium]
MSELSEAVLKKLHSQNFLTGNVMEQNTQVETRVQNEVGIIDIAGEVTSFSEKILEEAYEKLTADGIKKIGFNFKNVSYINSAGMAIIISILTKSRARDQALRSWGLTDHFQKIFDMVGITKYMDHKQNEEEALKGF